ncbi:MAG: O-antigen ligase family protein [Candidatus Promineifilaceae bacterium]|nr:O-antigen ligase family protein [Candidatus Promineifilaceae bacterium]
MDHSFDESSLGPPPSGSPLIVGLLVGFFAVVGGVVLAFGGPLAALAVALGGGATLVVLRNIEVGFWGVIAVICLLPFGTIPVDIGLTPTFLDVALGAVVGVWALGLATGRQRTIITTPITLPLVIFMLVAVFSFIFGLGNGPLTPTLLRHFAELLLSLGFVLVVIDYCRTWERLERLVRVLLLAGAGAAAGGIFLWLLPDDTANMLLNALQRVGYPGGWVIRYIEENPELAERAIGTSVDPNSFGGLLLLVGAVAGPQLVARRPLLPRWLVATVVGLIFLALVLTFSRGAMLGLVAGLGFVAVVRYRRLLPYMAAAGLLILLLPVTQGYVQRFIAGIRGQDLATQMRFGEYADALTLMRRYPLFGVGFAGSPDLDVYLGVANVYLTIGGQMGILGLLSFLAVMGTVFGYAFVHRDTFKGNERMDSVWLGLHAALVGGLVTGIFDHYLFNIDFHHAVTLFWMLVGLAVAATRLGKQEAAADE